MAWQGVVCAGARAPRIAWLGAVAAAALVLLAQAAAAQVRAEPYRWQNVTVGGGGFAPNVIFSRAARGLAYLRTDMGGAYRWDEAGGRWLPLQDANPVGSYMGIESIAADPVDANIVYLAAGMGYWGEAAIWRSTDRGDSWQVVPVPFKMGGNEDGRGLGERLAIDPNRTATLLFGSRHDGLQRSDDSGRTWRRVEAFPHRGLGPPTQRRSTHAGISFVLLDRSSGSAGQGSQTVYAAIADPAEQRLIRSTDGGRSWAPVPGGPPAAMIPVRAEIDDNGQLYIAYGTDVGPSGIADGAVWRLDTRTGNWTDITPDPASEGGYMGISVDRQRPGRLVVSSINRWQPGDTVWLSENGGRSWTDLGPLSRRDTSSTPFLRWGAEDSAFGHWTAGLAIDPHDGRTIAYTTGDTLYRTDDAAPGARTMVWRPWVRGIEQTAVITLISPAGGAHLISGFGDIAGFVHARFDQSPPRMHLNPRLSNTNNLDYAGLRPEIVVRSGSRHGAPPPDAASLGWSEDGGNSWQPLRVPALRDADTPPMRFDLDGEAPITVSADGAVFVVGTPVVVATRDRGRRWFVPEGLPDDARVIADKADPNLFYAVDPAAGRLLASRDGAASFAPVAGEGLPSDLSTVRPRNREAQPALQVEPGRAGALWLKVGGRLYHSEDGGAHFRQARGDLAIDEFGMGRAAPGQAAPAIYATGTRGNLRGVWRSTDGGDSWVRINDDAHQWGLRFRAVSGDPRIFGRVYLATDGRGVLYGDPVAQP